ncbi:hypothetical protein GCM10010430_53590 [Kitasatospora cystarginea]|uniref:Chaplin domain-containing protein n=1 Tax=Kitasatospora cystarginea TaxID=58350 RepID=A0ABN3EL74_9ACTN
MADYAGVGSLGWVNGGCADGSPEREVPTLFCGTAPGTVRQRRFPHDQAPSPQELEKTVKDIRRALVLAGAAGALVLGSAGVASASATATGTATDSPGVLSGNVIQIPIDIPVNLCGNTINLVGLLNPASGNTCSNAG